MSEAIVQTSAWLPFLSDDVFECEPGSSLSAQDYNGLVYSFDETPVSSAVSGTSFSLLRSVHIVDDNDDSNNTLSTQHQFMGALVNSAIMPEVSGELSLDTILNLPELPTPPTDARIEEAMARVYNSSLISARATVANSSISSTTRRSHNIVDWAQSTKRMSSAAIAQHIDKRKHSSALPPSPPSSSINTSQNPLPGRSERLEDTDVWISLMTEQVDKPQKRQKRMLPDKVPLSSWEDLQFSVSAPYPTTPLPYSILHSSLVASMPDLVSPYVTESSVTVQETIYQTFFSDLLPSGRPVMAVVPQNDVIRDLIYLMCGIESNLFSYDGQIRSFMVNDVDLRMVGWSFGSVQSILERFVHIGTHMRQLDETHRKLRNQPYGYGLVGLALANALSEYAIILRGQVISLGDNINKNPCTILQIYINVRDLEYQLALLLHHLDKTFSLDSPNKQIINLLHDALSELDILSPHTSSGSDCEVVNKFKCLLAAQLSVVTWSYHNWLMNWLGITTMSESYVATTMRHSLNLKDLPNPDDSLLADLSFSLSATSLQAKWSMGTVFSTNLAVLDPYNEFMIQPQISSIEWERHGDLFWTQGYEVIHAKVPHCLEVTAEVVLQAGKLLRIMKNVYPSHLLLHIDFPSLGWRFRSDDQQKYLSDLSAVALKLLQTYQRVELKRKRALCNLSPNQKGGEESPVLVDANIISPMSSLEQITYEEAQSPMLNASIQQPDVSVLQVDEDQTMETVQPQAEPLLVPVESQSNSNSTLSASDAHLSGGFSICFNHLLEILHSTLAENKDTAYMLPHLLYTETYQMSVFFHCRLTQLFVIKHLLEDCHLLAHLQLIQNIYFMRDPNFKEMLTSALLSDLSDAEDQEIAWSTSNARSFREDTGRQRVRGLCLHKSLSWPPRVAEVSAALTNILSTCLTLRHNSASVIQQLLHVVPDLEQRLGFVVYTDVAIDTSDDASALDFLNFEYRPPEPVYLILSPAFLGKCNTVMLYLLRLLRLSTATRTMFRQSRYMLGLTVRVRSAKLINKDDSQMFDMLKRIDRVITDFCLIAQHLVSSLWGYTQEAAIDNDSELVDTLQHHLQNLFDIPDRLPTSTEQIHSTQGTAKFHTVKDIYTYHMNTMESMLFRCILHPHQVPIRKIINGAFGHILQFGAYVSTATAARKYCIDLISMRNTTIGQDQTAHHVRFQSDYANSIADMNEFMYQLHKAMDECHVQFNVCMRMLVSVLRGLEQRAVGQEFIIDDRRSDTTNKRVKGGLKDLLMRLDFNHFYTPHRAQ